MRRRHRRTQSQVAERVHFVPRKPVDGARNACQGMQRSIFAIKPKPKVIIARISQLLKLETTMFVQMQMFIYSNFSTTLCCVIHFPRFHDLFPSVVVAVCWLLPLQSSAAVMRALPEPAVPGATYRRAWKVLFSSINRPFNKKYPEISRFSEYFSVLYF